MVVAHCSNDTRTETSPNALAKQRTENVHICIIVKRKDYPIEYFESGCKGVSGKPSKLVNYPDSYINCFGDHSQVVRMRALHHESTVLLGLSRSQAFQLLLAAWHFL
jgi:hypothetical protein